MILVVGASGYLGRHTARRLLAAGCRVRAVSRAPDHLSDLRERGAEVQPADLVDAGSVRAACEGVRAVFAAAHSLMGTGLYASQRVDGDGHRTLIDAARSAGVQRFVYTSALFASRDHPVDFMRTKADVESYLAASGMAFTILRPSAFMEWHVHDLLGKALVETGKATIFGKGTNPINFVAVDDVAAVATEAILDPGAASATLDIGGPDNVTRNDIVALYEERLARPVVVRHVPITALRVMRQIVRPFQPVLARLMSIAVWSESSDQTFDLAAHEQCYARPVTCVRDFIASRVPTSGVIARVEHAT